MNMMKNLSSSSNTITPHIINSIWKLRFLHADHRVGYKGPSRARLLASFGTSLVNKQTNKQTTKTKRGLVYFNLQPIDVNTASVSTASVMSIVLVPPWAETRLRWCAVTHCKMVYGDAQSFLVVFHNFWYINGWVSVPDLIRPICKIGCILENLAKKAPNLPQFGCFLRQIGIVMGLKITLFEV